MLFTPLTTLFFLVPLSTALDQFRHGVILEYADASGLTKRDNIVDHVARSLPGVKLKHRMDLSSDRIFHGASFRVTETAGHVDDNLLRRALTQYRDVITVYPLDVVQLQVQPTFDDSRGAAVRPRDVAQGAGAEADHVARARVPDQTSTRTRARKHRPREDAGLTDSGAGTGNSSASGLYVNYGTEGSPLVNPHASTGVDRLHAEQLTGRGVRIALLDSGIDAFHPALGGGYGPGFKVYGGADLTGESLDDPNSSVYTPGSSPLTQCENHGTGTASVAAGLPYHFGFVGVAPNASIEMYKVMKCRATTVHSDVGVKASIMAFDSGVDVISMSIGGPGGWSNSAWAIVLERIIAQGTLVIVSAGNFGAKGPWIANGIAGGFDTPNVASAGGPYSPTLIANGSYSVNGGPPIPMQYVPGYPANWSSSVEVLYAPNFTGCAPMPDLGAKPNQVILLQSPWTPQNADITCSTNLSDTALGSGLKNMILYMKHDETPDQPVPIDLLDGLLYALDGMATMSRSLALQLVQHAAQGDKVTLNLPWRPDGPETRMLSMAKNTVSGGRPSYFTSWGPSYETKLGPAVMAPGGMSLVLSGRMLGGLDVASGTSFSTPYIAGVAALVKQVNPGLSPADVVNRIAAAARPAPMASWRDDPVPGGLLAPTFQQGAGMIDAYAAVHATVVLNVSSLAFNDTAHLKPLSFEICNLGTQAVDVHIAHAPAATVYSFAPGHIKVKAYREDDFVAQNVVDKPASLTFAGSATLDIHLAAGQNYTVTVAAVPPAGLDAARLPLLSGFVNMTTSAGDVLTLPYGIIGEPLVDVHNLDPQKTFLTYDSLWDEFDNGWVPFTNSSQSIVLPQKVPADPTTLYNTSLPGWTFVTVFGSRLLQVHLIRNDTGEDLGQVALLPGSDSGSPAKKVVDTWIRNERSFGQWAGQLLQSDGTTAAAPNGTYRFSIQLLKVSGNPQKPGDFDEVLTDPFRVEMV